jgi:hypothetical protein
MDLIQWNGPTRIQSHVGMRQTRLVMGAWVSHGSHQVVTDLGFEPHLGFKPILGRALDCEDPGGFCLPACLLVEIRWQKGKGGRQADQMST